MTMPVFRLWFKDYFDRLVKVKGKLEYRAKWKMRPVHSLHVNTKTAIVSTATDGKAMAKSINLTQDAFLMQFTGMKDKNSVMIFEGDLVRVEHDCEVCEHKKIVGIVEYAPHQATWMLDFGSWSVMLAKYETPEDLEIVGNYYEDSDTAKAAGLV